MGERAVAVMACSSVVMAEGGWDPWRREVRTCLARSIWPFWASQRGLVAVSHERANRIGVVVHVSGRKGSPMAKMVAGTSWSRIETRQPQYSPDGLVQNVMA